MKKTMQKPKGALCLVYKEFRYAEVGEEGFKPHRVYVKFSKAPKSPKENVFVYMEDGLLELLARTVDFVPDAGKLEEFSWFCEKFVLVWNEKDDLTFRNGNAHSTWKYLDSTLRRRK